MRPHIHECCVKFDWRFVADLQQADGLELTLGKCAVCGANLVNLWSDDALDSQNYIIVDEEFVAQVTNLEGVALKQFLHEWLNAG
jgi:hypothetical protein